MVRPNLLHLLQSRVLTLLQIERQFLKKLVTETLVVLGIDFSTLESVVERTHILVCQANVLRV